MHITATTLNQICALSETLSPVHRKMVADNIRSIAEAHFSESVWMRAIYADETPIGFIMAHAGSDYEDWIDCPGVFLWRFMIGGPWQGKGSPEGFYRKLGFVPTGDHFDEEIELVLHLDTYPIPVPVMITANPG